MSVFKEQSLSNESMLKLLSYYEYVWIKDRDRTEFTQAAGNLPDALQRKIELALHMEIFNRLSLLHGRSEEVLAKVARALNPIIFVPGDSLIIAGQVSKRMYFITNGKLNAYAQTGSLLHKLDGSHGCVFGEQSLILRRSETVTVMAETFVEAYELSKSDYDEIPELHPLIDGIQNNPVLYAITDVHL